MNTCFRTLGAICCLKAVNRRTNAVKGGERWIQDDIEERGRDDMAFVMML